MSGTGYADIEQPLAETLETFAITKPLTNSSNNQWFFPSVITTGEEAYMVLRVDCFDASGNRLGEAEKVSNDRVMLLLDSPMVAPTNKYPVYVLETTSTGESVVTIYPSTINSANNNTIKCTYFSYPKDPKWTYVTLSSGTPVFDPSQPDYQDFQLPLEDEYKLVMKILQYSGLSIREADVVAYAMGQEQHEQPTFSQQQ